MDSHNIKITHIFELDSDACHLLDLEQFAVFLPAKKLSKLGTELKLEANLWCELLQGRSEQTQGSAMG